MRYGMLYLPHFSTGGVWYDYQDCSVLLLAFSEEQKKQHNIYKSIEFREEQNLYIGQFRFEQLNHQEE